VLLQLIELLLEASGSLFPDLDLDALEEVGHGIQKGLQELQPLGRMKSPPERAALRNRNTG
jgi:hypothetical protein